MNRKIKQLFKNLKYGIRDNMGSTMVIVIVALAFVGILGATIMWMSLNNYMMKTTDARQKESFYSAETVMEQIVAGLQEDASAAVEDSYTKVLQKYSNSNETQRRYEFQTEYFLALKKELEDGSGTFKIDKLVSYVDPTLLDEGTTGRTRQLTSTASQMVVNPTSIVLKDIHLVFEDERGLTSIIHTDITIGVPSIDFTQSSSVPDIFNYCLIAEKSLTGASGTGQVTVNGSIYGGSGYTETEIAADPTLVDKNGIVLNDKWKIQNADKIVTNQDITLTNANAELIVGGADDNDVPMLWAENINVDSGNIKLHAKSYISDDLTLSGNGATATLEKDYYGYGNSLTDTSASSAIIINGIGTTLNMQKLEQMLLAGHAYIGTSQASTETVLPNGTSETTKNVMMGESIAIKGNQIAYLVPDECIGVLDGITMVGKNPMSQKDYEAMIAEYNKYKDDPDHTYEIVSPAKPIEALGGVPLSAYASSTDPTTQVGNTDPGLDPTDKIYTEVFYPSNGETVVYYYMKLTEANANKYFADYYGLKKEKLDNYFSIYTSGAGIQTNNHFTRINTQGNWMSSADAAVGTGSALNVAKPEDAVELITENEHYTKVYEALKAKLVLSDTATDDEKKNGVFKNIINVTEVTNFTGVNGGEVDFTTTDGFKAVITNGDFHYTGAGDQKKIRLIVSLKDVTISGDFTGLIMAQGDVLVQSGATINSAGEEASVTSTGREELTKVLQCKLSDTVETRPIDLFMNSSKYILDGTAIDADDAEEVINPVVFQNLVQYANWTKQ